MGATCNHERHSLYYIAHIFQGLEQSECTTRVLDLNKREGVSQRPAGS